MKAVSGKIFFRGIRLNGRKSLTCASPIEPLAPQGELYIPLKQHLGAPAAPCVEVGQQVKRGQLIAEAGGAVSACVHASAAGTVKAIGERGDGRGTYVTVACSGGTEEAFLPPLHAPTAEEIAARVKEAGIVGMGGAGFPTHVKLSPRTKVDALVLNGAECEPYLTCDDRLMREARDKIVRGAYYLSEALGANRIYIGIERNKPEAIALFEQTDLAVVALKKRYPMGSEKHLIYCCTGRKVPVGGLPADVGVNVQNVSTAFAVCEAVEEGKPLIERVVTVSGGGIAQPKNLLCPVGVPLSALIGICGGETGDAVKYITGGPMTGIAHADLNGVVTKTTSALLLLTARETDTHAPTPCINCGKCAQVCPMKLMPMQIEFYTAAKDYESAERRGGVLSCIECGACSYICPARRPLSQCIKTAKEMLRRNMR